MKSVFILKCCPNIFGQDCTLKLQPVYSNIPSLKASGMGKTSAVDSGVD